MPFLYFKRRPQFIQFCGIILIAAIAGAGMCAGQAQQNATDTTSSGDLKVSGSLRSRVEVWNWFESDGNNQYAFSDSIFRLSFSASKERYEWKLEFAAPILLGLPANSTVPGPQGALGLGANYYAANDQHTNAASLFPKQGFVRFKFDGATWKQSVQLGRTEFIDGGETIPKNATLAAVKRDRIAQRLVANFGFSDVGRSFDAVEYIANGSATNLTLMAARPTRGVFQVDGWGEVNVNVFYGALTHDGGSNSSATDWRLFGIGYGDERNGVVKVDNRPQAVRSADHDHIHIATVGGHYLHVAGTNAGTIDLLFWGAFQGGAWGTLSQRAGAFAAEAGWQPPILRRVKPWLRGGYDYGSGDKDPTDKTHGTFFQLLPTPRIYARFPFFNMMNNRDAFGEIILRPAKAVVIRSDIHALSLASTNDLWYSGGGVYQPWTFGYTGRPSNGHSALATLYDISADCTFSRSWSMGLYYGHAAGKTLIQLIYPKGRSGDFGFVEVNWSF
jgi:hypothetical protein